jgi:hypothetical protein
MGNYTPDPSFNLSFIQLAIHSGPLHLWTPLHPSLLYTQSLLHLLTFLHEMPMAQLLLTHYTNHLPWTVTVYNIPTVLYRLQCLNSSWVWRQETPLESGNFLASWHGIISQKTSILIGTTMKTSNHALWKNFTYLYIKPSCTDGVWGTFTLLPTIILPSHPFWYISANQKDLSLAKVITIHNLWKEWLHVGRGM